MAYTAYSTQKVFYNELVNILCNKVLDNVHSNFASSEAKLVASDDLSRMIQGDAVAELPVVSLVTNDSEIYKHLVLELENIISVQTQLSFKNRIQAVTPYAYFEFWYDAAMAATVNINGIYCRDYSETYSAPASPYNIPLADPQVFTVSASNELYFQKWKADVVSPLKIFYLAGGNPPADVDINVDIENHFATEESGVYASFKAFAEVLVYSGENDNLVLSNTDMATAGGLAMTENNLSQVLRISYADLAVTNPGTYYATIRMWVDGVRVDTGLTDRYLSQKDIKVEFRVFNPSSVSADLSQMHFSHIRNTAPLAAQQLHIYTGIEFHLDIPEYFTVTGGNIQLIDDNVYPNLHRYSGTGEQILNIATSAEFDLYTDPTYSNALKVYDPNGSGSLNGFGSIIIPWTVKLDVIVRDAHGFYTDPGVMEFFAIKQVESAQMQELVVVSTENFTVTKPYWLDVNPLAGGLNAILEVKPISYSNLIAGTYEGVITLTSANAEVEIPVVHTVVENVATGLSNLLNFADDNEAETVIYSNALDERASIDVDLISYNFRNTASEYQRNFKLAFSRNKTSLHIGNVIKSHLSRLEDLDDFDFKFLDLEESEPVLYQVFSYYKPANAHITLNIENRDTGSSIKKKELRDVKFIAGRKPADFQNNYGILDYYNVPERVTVNSQMLFNFYREFSQHDIRVYRNQNLIKTITHSPGNSSLFGLAMFFTDFKPGDVIDIKLKKNEQEDFVKQYVMLPENKHSSHIVWMDEYYVLRSYEFTGEFEVSSDYEFIKSKSYKKLVEVTENLESTKEVKLVVNSGWILKSNQVIMDSILRSKRAWFVKNGKSFWVEPESKKLLHEDSLQELYAYELEFKINRKNDLEIYTS